MTNAIHKDVALRTVALLCAGIMVVVMVLFGYAGTAGAATSVTVDTNNRNLTELFILTELFNDDDDNGGDTDITELFVLSELFGGAGVGLFASQRTVIVEPGDTLSGIARDVYGDASLFPIIAQANNLADPDVIRVGQRLVIPDVGATFGTRTNLSELILLEALTDGDFSLDLNGDSDLAQLFILTEVLGNGGQGSLLGGTDSSLAELFILNQIFVGDDNNGNKTAQ